MKKSIPAPVQFLKDCLSGRPISREALKERMVKEKYAIGTINTQLFQLRHWPGCVVTEAGFAKNPDYEEPQKEKKTTKTVKVPSKRKEKRAAKPKTFHPVPKPNAETIA